MPARPSSDRARPRRSPPACRSARRSARATGSSQVVSGCQSGVELQEAADRRRARRARRPSRPSRAGPRGRSCGRCRCSWANSERLAAEDDEEEPERVEAGQERAGEADGEQAVAERALRQRRGDDRVLREEAGERRDADERERSRSGTTVRVYGQRLAEPAHPADVLLAGERVDDDPGGEEEQRLEEGVRHQVEHRRPGRRRRRRRRTCSRSATSSSTRSRA